MRFTLPAAAVFLLAACSSSPVDTAKEKAKPEPVARTGRAGIQSAFPTARGWAPDADLLTARNLHLKNRIPAEGQGYAWEVTFASPSLSSSRTFIWSAVAEEGLNEGVFGGPPRAWNSRSQPAVQINTVKIDTAEALTAASQDAKSYLAKPGDKPRVTFMLEFVPRYNAAVWRVMWGLTPGSSEFTVFVHAETGKVLGRA